MPRLSWPTSFFLFTSAVGAAVTPSASLPVIKTSVGSFQGFTNAASSFEAWLGVPYAQAPVGDLRFRAPVALTTPFKGVRNATAFGSACPQPSSSATNAVGLSEDCLFLNIFRPQNTKANTKLPVLVWFHGGGYITGVASDPSFNPTFLLNRSTTIGKPVIFVSANYRLNSFGFLASSFVPSQDLNAGLLDTREALRFIKKEIAAFGGDPNKVTVWGQSAGAGVAETHILFPAQEPLFRAAILDSSTGPFKSAPFASQYDAPGKPFARLVEMVGCGTPSTAALECLRKAPFQTVMNVSNQLIDATLNQQLWQPAPGPADSLMPERPSARIASGNFLRVPVLAGTNLNEGTGFSVSVQGLPKMTAAEEDARFDLFISQLVMDNSTFTADVLDEIHKLYPSNDTSLGGRFNTGDSLFDRAEAWYTDNMYLAPRRLFFNKAAQNPSQKLFAYFFTEFFPGNDPKRGVFHGEELGLIFGGAPASENSFAATFTDAYLNFINDLNPGSFWPQYTSRSKSVLQLMKDNITVIPDDFLVSKTNFLNSAKVLNEFEK